MSITGKLVYTAKTRITGGRETGTARSSDGRLDIRLAIPGSARIGTNPEQLFAAAWSACFESAIMQVAGKQKVVVPASSVIDAEVDLKLENDSYVISAKLNVSLPGVDRMVAQTLVNDAHEICAYSKAMRGNVQVAINLV